jgi:hypothetical protein
MTTSPRFARSPSLNLDKDGLFSSPDPLATSVNDENTFPRSSPLKDAYPSPRKRRTAKVLEDITLSSPQKVRTSSSLPSNPPSHSQNGHFLSPWKIRVTVEAEPDGEAFGKVRSMSKTTVVPLRDATALPKESRVQGRSRSRSGSRKPGSKRTTNATPKRQTPQRSGANVSRLSDLDTGFLDGDDGEAQSKLKKRSRGRASGKACEIIEHEVSANEDTMFPKDLEASQSPKNTETGAESEAVVSDARGPLKPRELDSNRTTVGSRAMLPSARMPREQEAFSDNEKPSVAAIPAARSSTATYDGNRQTSAANVVTYPTPDASVQDESEAVVPQNDPTEEHAGFDTILESEGFTMIDLESLPSARHFVTTPEIPRPPQEQPLAEMRMYADLNQPRSVSSPVPAPPSSFSEVSSPTSLSDTIKPPATPIPSYLAPPEEGESDLSSTVPSSPPVHSALQTFPARSVRLATSPLHQIHTPIVVERTSPELPRPPNQPQKDEVLVTTKDIKPTPPRLARVVQAGITLQRLLAPKSIKPSPRASPLPKAADTEKRSASAPTGRLDGLFVGFDSGTRRELRAGLRFGEELAKRQRLSSPGASSFGQRVPPVPKSQSQQGSDSAWGAETTIKETLIRCSDSQDTRSTSEDGDGGISQGSSGAQMLETPFDANKSVGSIIFLDANARERRWQLERAAISQQIEDANTSQVIMIDSDSEDEAHKTNAKASAIQPRPTRSMTCEADEDIWLAQAEDVQSSSQRIREDLFPRVEQVRQRERAREVYLKPRRTLIPSPWKRGDDVDSTFMIAGDASGIFWQQPKEKESAKSLPPLSSIIDAGEARIRKSDGDRMHDKPSVTGRSRPVNTEEILSRAYQVAEEYRQERPSASDDGEESPEHEGEMEDEEGLELAPEVDAALRKDEDTCEGYSFEPLPAKIPVNFNETDLSIRSEDPFQDHTRLRSPSSSSCRPPTPRSAFKGSRATLDLISVSASPTPRKVAFSRYSLCLDESGMETSMQVRGGTMSPEPLAAHHDLHDDDTVAADAKVWHDVVQEESSGAVADVPASVPEQVASVSWFSRLTDWGLKSAPTVSDAPTAPAPRQQQQHSQTAKLSSCEKSIQWELTRAAIASTGPCIAPALSEPSSQGTDPRIPPSPERLSISGYFSDSHYKHLHILYLKSLKSTFTRPGSVRPSLLKNIGQKCYSGDGEFAWEITRRDAEVVERWIRSFEGRDARDAVTDWSDQEARYRKVGWDELDLCMRLFSIVAGQETRREQNERREKQRLKKG